jgi:hypothetical protein
VGEDAVMTYRARLVKWNDYRTVLGDEYRTVVSRVGFQAGAVAHVVRDGSEASLCGIPRSALTAFEDLDEPVCLKCIEWHARLGMEDRTEGQAAQVADGETSDLDVIDSRPRGSVSVESTSRPGSRMERSEQGEMDSRKPLL